MVVRTCDTCHKVIEDKQERFELERFTGEGGPEPVEHLDFDSCKCLAKFAMHGAMEEVNKKEGQ